jgi:hypothetical protein
VEERDCRNPALLHPALERRAADEAFGVGVGKPSRLGLHRWLWVLKCTT